MTVAVRSLHGFLGLAELIRVLIVVVTTDCHQLPFSVCVYATS